MKPPPLAIGLLALSGILLAFLGTAKEGRDRSAPGCLLSAAGALLTTVTFVVYVVGWFLFLTYYFEMRSRTA